MRDFNETYEMLEKLENDRKRLAAGQVIMFIVGIAASVVLCIIMHDINRLCSAPFIILEIIYQFVSRPKMMEFRSLYKELFVVGPLNNSFDDVFFRPDQGLLEGQISTVQMIRMGNKFSSDDYIKATYKGTKFEQSDISIMEEKGSGKYRSTTTYFKGRWMIFDFNKNFRCNMLACKKGYNHINTKKALFETESEYQKIKFEDEQFNNMFDVYSNDVTDAFYILTPQLMEKIREIQNRNSGALILCFYNNKLHVGINDHKNAFEPHLFRAVDVSEINEEVYNEISVVTEMVDELKLNEKIYKQ